MLLLDFLFPRRSLTGSEGAFVTPEECARLQPDPVVEDRDALRQRGIVALDHIRAAVPYRQSLLLRRAVHTLKYKRIPGVAETLGSLLVAGCTENTVHGLWFMVHGGQPSTMYHEPSTVLCPVPLHWSRRFSRGFNQADLLASIVSSATGIPVQPLLRRTRATGFQAHRGRAQRLTAVRRAFRLRQCAPLPHAVILIDDLATTGATLDACALELKRGGVKWVEGWVVAHG